MNSRLSSHDYVYNEGYYIFLNWFYRRKGCCGESRRGVGCPDRNCRRFCRAECSCGCWWRSRLPPGPPRRRWTFPSGCPALCDRTATTAPHRECCQYLMPRIIISSLRYVTLSPYWPYSFYVLRALMLS